MEVSGTYGAAASAVPQVVKLLLTVPEAADALGPCRSVVYELMLCGELRSVKIGRTRRIPVAVLEDFIARRKSWEGAD